MLNIYTLYFSCFRHTLANKKSAQAVAYESMRDAHSFRVKGSNVQKDRLAPLRYWVRANRLIWNNDEQSKVFENKPGRALLNLNIDLFEPAYRYTQDFAPEKIVFSISRDCLAIRGNYGFKLQLTLFSMLHMLVLLPISILSGLKKKTNLGLMVMELVETCMILKHFRSREINYMYMFGAFEKDANFLALALRQYSITCHKLPSSKPLQFHYAKVVSDVFSFTAPFHKEEYQTLKQNWYVESIEEWPYWNYRVLWEEYRKQTVNPPQNTLGFLANGVWRRREKGNKESSPGVFESEIELIKGLKSYLKKHPQVTFYVFLHPCEKENDVLYQRAKSYYIESFETDKIVFLPREKPSWKAFNKVDLTISVFSNTNIERLFSGFKALYAPLSMEVPFYDGTSIEGITVKRASQLEDLISESLKQTTDEFFTENKLIGYRHFEYEILKRIDPDLGSKD